MTPFVTKPLFGPWRVTTRNDDSIEPSAKVVHATSVHSGGGGGVRGTKDADVAGGDGGPAVVLLAAATVGRIFLSSFV